MAEEENEIVAMLHGIRSTWWLGDRIWRIDYIAGWQPLRAWRHQGYMSRLLSRIFADMYMEKMGFCFLHPVTRLFICPLNLPIYLISRSFNYKRKRDADAAERTRPDGTADRRNARRLPDLRANASKSIMRSIRCDESITGLCAGR